METDARCLCASPRFETTLHAARRGLLFCVMIVIIPNGTLDTLDTAQLLARHRPLSHHDHTSNLLLSPLRVFLLFRPLNLQHAATVCSDWRLYETSAWHHFIQEAVRKQKQKNSQVFWLVLDLFFFVFFQRGSFNFTVASRGESGGRRSSTSSLCGASDWQRWAWRWWWTRWRRHKSGFYARTCVSPAAWGSLRRQQPITTKAQEEKKMQH